MSTEIYVNKPGTVWSISLNLMKVLGEEIITMPVIMGATPVKGNELTPGIYDTDEDIMLGLEGKTTILWFPIELLTVLPLSDPEALLNFMATMQPKLIVNPCTHLVVSPSEYFICQALPSNAFVGSDTSTKAESSNVSNKVILGRSAEGESYAVAVGADAFAGDDSTSLGYDSDAEYEGVAIGTMTRAYCTGSIAIGGTSYDSESTDNCGILTHVQTIANGDAAIAIGRHTYASANGAIAIGNYIANYNADSIVLGARPGEQNLSTCLTTRLFIMPAGSALANKYEGGAACMGYTVQQGDIYGTSTGTGESLIIECGTRKLSEIFTNNTAFAPAALDPDVEHMPFNPDAEALPLPIPEREQSIKRELPSNPLLEHLASKMREKLQSGSTPDLPAFVKRLLATTKE